MGLSPIQQVLRPIFKGEWAFYARRKGRRGTISSKEKVKMLVALYHSMDYSLWPARLICPWDSPGKDTGVDSHALLQGIFPVQG